MRCGWLLGPMALIVAGCATVNTVSEPVILPDTVTAIRTWSMDGRIGVKAKDQAWQANLVWEHDPQQDRLRISGPLNQGLVSVIVQKDLIYINEGNGVSELSKDPDAALRKKLGFAVPLGSLRYWIMGVPDPDRSSSPLGYSTVAADAEGFLQSGWTVQPDKMANVNGWMLPRTLNVQGAGVKLKILADNWMIKD